MKNLRFGLLILLLISLTATPVFCDLILSKVDRRIDLTSQIVRITESLKVENGGSDLVSEFLLAFPEIQAKNLAYLSVSHNVGKRKTKASSSSLPVEAVNPKGVPPALSLYSVTLPKALGKGDSLNLEVFSAFTRILQPFPEKISQAGIQLVLFQQSAHYLSPYAVNAQSLSIKLPDARIESYTKLEGTKIHGSEIKYGPFENIPPFSYTPLVVHFESNKPFAVANELLREIEVSHWGNVQVTEHYNVVHGGAEIKGEFSRLDFQARSNLGGLSALKQFVARLPPRAHSIYYRDEIGNISTSHLWSDSRRTELLIEPRFPLFGGWRTAFTLGYGLPLNDFLFASDGKRFLNISFGSPIREVVTEKLVVKVVLPEGSKDISISVPFSVKEGQETTFSHLDMVGRPVIVLEKTNVVPEHNQHFQVYYKFNSLNMLREPLMLILGFFFFFITCIIYSHADLSISKSSASYLAKLQWDEVQAAIQQIQSIINKCLAAHDKLESSLRDLSRTGDIQVCKAARKAVDVLLKDLSKDLKPLLGFLQSSPSAAQIFPKVEELVVKEKELQEKVMAKHSMVMDGYEKKSSGRDIENRISAQQQKITTLRQEIDDLLEYIDEI